MNETTNTLIYRHLDIQRDLAALVGLLQEVRRHDHADENVTEAALREQLTWSGQDPTPNNLIVLLPDGETCVGCGSVQKTLHDDNVDLNIIIHPAWRGRGIGSQVFARMLERARELGGKAARIYVNVKNVDADRFVRKQGGEPVSAYVRMSVPGSRIFPNVVLPQGFTLRSYDQVQNIELYTQAMNRCYEGQWGHLHVSQDEVSQFLPQLNPSGIFLLFAPGDTIAGTCRAILNENNETESEGLHAFIDAPGIVPAYRDAHLVLPLLLTAIHWVLPRHPAVLELESWGDRPDTLAIYRSLGFTVQKEETSYRLPLD